MQTIAQIESEAKDLLQDYFKRCGCRFRGDEKIALTKLLSVTAHVLSTYGANDATESMDRIKSQIQDKRLSA